MGGSTEGLISSLISGWQLNGIVTFSDGVGLSALTGFNASQNGDVLNPDRPDLVPGRSNSPVLGGPDQYFDPTSFVAQTRGTLGNVARNSIRGPGFANVDFAVIKSTQLVGGDSPVEIQFRAEFFNIFNRPNFGLPDPTIFNNPGFFVPTFLATRRGAAGRISNTTSTSRQIQFGLKILF